MKVITDPLGGSPLTQAFLTGSAPATWYPALANSSVRQFLAANAKSVAAEFKDRDWLTGLQDAFGSLQSPAHERLKEAAKNGFVITTGQQPGLFGGPLYTLSKALTALALADRLQKETGLPAAPVFWAATDDADFAESASIVIPSSEGAVELTLEKRDEIQRPLADEPLPDIQRQLDEFLRGVGSSSSAQTVELVQRSYAKGETVGSAYLRLLRGILEPLGISVLDAAHPQVRQAGHSILMTALQRAKDVADALSERNKEIKAAGFKAQVREVKGRSLVFRYSSNGKERIPASESAATHAPGDLSATVLLRPIMERAILPTAAYVGGPAEVAYFAQVSAVAEAIDAKQPIVVPRWSGTVLEPRVERILQRYNLKAEDFADPHKLETRQARASIPEGIQSLLAKLRASSASVSESDLESNLTPRPVLTGLQRDLDHRLDRFERRIAAAVKREGTQELRDLQAARASLYPLGKPQERAVSFVALLARYGSELQAKMLDSARAHVRSLG
jgi:uncharacterized protein YllA (UPF0747 family)